MFGLVNLISAPRGLTAETFPNTTGRGSFPDDVVNTEAELKHLQTVSQSSIEQQKHIDALFETVSDHWIRREGEDPAKSILYGKFETTVRYFLQHLPPTEVLKAVDLAFERVGHANPFTVLRYFAGICWNKIRDIRPASKLR